MVTGIEKLPQFTILQIEHERSMLQCRGVFSRLQQISEGSGALLLASGDLCRGRLLSLDADTRSGVFVPEEAKAAPVLDLGTYAYLDGYWADRAELVLDESRTWTRTRFERQAALESKSPDARMLRRFEPDTEPQENERVVSGGWDHEHCEICWAIIGTSDAEFGFRDQHSNWVCELCFQTQVQRRNVGFLTGP